MPLIFLRGSIFLCIFSGEVCYSIPNLLFPLGKMRYIKAMANAQSHTMDITARGKNETQVTIPFVNEMVGEWMVEDIAFEEILFPLKCKWRRMSDIYKNLAQSLVQNVKWRNAHCLPFSFHPLPLLSRLNFISAKNYFELSWTSGDSVPKGNKQHLSFSFFSAPLSLLTPSPTHI